MMTSGLRVRDRLREMDLSNGFHGLEFDHEAVIDEQVEPSFADRLSAVRKRKGQLSVKGDPAVFQLNRESLLIDALQVPRSQSAMHINRCADHLFRCTLDAVVQLKFLFVSFVPLWFNHAFTRE